MMHSGLVILLTVKFYQVCVLYVSVRVVFNVLTSTGSAPFWFARFWSLKRQKVTGRQQLNVHLKVQLIFRIKQLWICFTFQQQTDKEILGASSRPEVARFEVFRIMTFNLIARKTTWMSPHYGKSCEIGVWSESVHQCHWVLEMCPQICT